MFAKRGDGVGRSLSGKCVVDCIEALVELRLSTVQVISQPSLEPCSLLVQHAVGLFA